MMSREPSPNNSAVHRAIAAQRTAFTSRTVTEWCAVHESATDLTTAVVSNLLKRIPGLVLVAPATRSDMNVYRRADQPQPSREEIKKLGTRSATGWRNPARKATAAGLWKQRSRRGDSVPLQPVAAAMPAPYRHETRPREHLSDGPINGSRLPAGETVAAAAV